MSLQISKALSVIERHIERLPNGIEKYKITADLFGKWDRNIQNTENQKIPLYGHYN